MQYKELAAALLARADTLLPAWFAAGRFLGHEFKIGNLAGDAGDSLSINTKTGIWADFAGDAKGGDLIALYAAIHDLKQSEAYDELVEQMGGGLPVSTPRPPLEPEAAPQRPNGHANGFQARHPAHGLPSALYEYRDAQGELLYLIGRYEPQGGKKQFCPWTWDGTQWRMRAWPAPRPLYGLELLAKHPKAKILIVEGEKCALAARALLDPRQHIVMTWPGGAASVTHCDWSVLAGRTVNIWPDNDLPGANAAHQIAHLLRESVREIGIIGCEFKPTGWDIADFIAEGADVAAIAAYAREHRQPAPSQPLEPIAAPEPPQREPGQSDDPDQDDKAPVRYINNQMWANYQLEPGPGGMPWANLTNAISIISQHPDTRYALWFDEFRDRLMWGEREFNSNVDASYLNLMMQSTLGLHKMATGTVLEACVTFAHRNKRHPLREWLRSLKDTSKEADLLERALPIAFGTTDDDYHRQVSRTFLLAMVARIMKPGCQHDTMPVFEGGQGIGKTSALRILAGEWYSSNDASMQEKDFLAGLQGYWLIEIEELESANRSSLERTKAILSRTRDDFRKSHRRDVKSYLRQCVFAGTTNSDMWNADDTGARRFLPVQCGRVDLTWLRAHRDALFAQAVRRFDAGEDWWDLPRERAREEQEQRHIDDPWMEDIARVIFARQHVTIGECFDAMSMAADKRTRATGMRISAVLKRLGWNSKVERFNKHPTRVYRPPSGRAVDAVRDTFDDDF